MLVVFTALETILNPNKFLLVFTSIGNLTVCYADLKIQVWNGKDSFSCSTWPSKLTPKKFRKLKNPNR